MRTLALGTLVLVVALALVLVRHHDAAPAAPAAPHGIALHPREGAMFHPPYTSTR